MALAFVRVTGWARGMRAELPEIYCPKFIHCLDSRLSRGLIVMKNSHLKLVLSQTENRTVPPSTPLRRPNSELRTREHFTPAEVGTGTRPWSCLLDAKTLS